MGRLIDVDAYVEKIKARAVSDEQKLLTAYIEESLNGEPTAYDVEKVVEQLKKASRNMMPVIPTKEAVEIVRNGGKE